MNFPFVAAVPAGRSSSRSPSFWYAVEHRASGAASGGRPLLPQRRARRAAVAGLPGFGRGFCFPFPSGASDKPRASLSRTTKAPHWGVSTNKITRRPNAGWIMILSEFLARDFWMKIAGKKAVH